jgi:hypothetical protein
VAEHQQPRQHPAAPVPPIHLLPLYPNTNRRESHFRVIRAGKG